MKIKKAIVKYLLKEKKSDKKNLEKTIFVYKEVK